MTPQALRIRPGARGGAYHRVSDLNGRDPDSEGYITEKQAWDEIGKWAGMRHVEIAEHYLDRDVSGSKMSRPEFDRMLSDLRDGRIDFIVIARVDRLSRADVGSAMMRVKEITDIAPGALAILDLGLDPATKMGEMVLTVLLALARMQWRGFQENWSDAQRLAVARGAWIGPAPFGYVATVIGHHRNGKPIHGPLEEHPVYGPVVREAFKVAASDGLHAAMAYLTSAVPDRRWRTDEARRLLGQRAYLGEVTYGEFVNHSAHPPLTTLARWTAAQTEPRQRRSNGDYPLSGIAQCQCGAPMVGALQTVHGRKYRRMRCSDPKCRGGSSISADRLEDFIREELRTALRRKRVTKALSPVGEDEAREALDAAEDERQRYLNDLDARRLAGSDSAWRAALETRARAVDEARERYRAIAGRAARSDIRPLAEHLDDPEHFERALAFIADVATITVRRGRGEVSERVGLDILHGEYVAGALAA